MSHLETFADSVKRRQETPEHMQQPEPSSALRDSINSINKFIQEWQAEKFPPGEGQTVPAQIEWFARFLTQNPQIKTVWEIGMNQGLSTGCILACRPDIKVVSIDIGLHDYVPKAQKMLGRLFPNRHLLILGDSTDVLPQLTFGLSSRSPDLIFMDGGHTEPVVSLDITNCLNACNPATFLVIDDYHLKYPYQREVMAAVDKALANKRMKMLGQWEGQQREWGLFKKLW